MLLPEGGISLITTCTNAFGTDILNGIVFLYHAYSPLKENEKFELLKG